MIIASNIVGDKITFEDGVSAMEINLIKFDTTIGKTKPVTLIDGRHDACPFCDVAHLTGIIDTDDDIIFLKNKYNVVVGADQFVLIEGRECGADMPDYSLEHMTRVLSMALKHWRRLLDSGSYKEVLFFKNFGPMSGGTIKHPHMQLVGFPDLRAELLFDPIELTGLEIKKEDGVELNISTCPRVGFGELNVISAFDLPLAKFLQVGVHYLMHHFRKNLTSYNLFFYHRGEKFYVKMMPRFATSPYFVGYNIRFRPNNLEQIAAEIKRLYF